MAVSREDHQRSALNAVPQALHPTRIPRTTNRSRKLEVLTSNPTPRECWTSSPRCALPLGDRSRTAADHLAERLECREPGRTTLGLNFGLSQLVQGQGSLAMHQETLQLFFECAESFGGCSRERVLLVA